MKTTIGKFDPATRTVAVTFVHQGITHKRRVNAVLTATDAYDVKATRARVAEVALGVERKIELGAFTPLPDPEPEGDETPAE
jgi:hypothetical protein